MNRRQLLSAAALAAVIPVSASAGGKGRVEYSPSAYRKALASGEPLLLDFYTEW